ncbi:MAG: sigma-E processing peptidase SpoIIGA [Candidatus Fermentithermobacillus carboniphilus]|uniref:Sporulation sigma-E factor-processing peptidase n=1 Tax=Candidatus Fermentithermobacillus carboniphilus TaxID=3085328 RepID=A0AAT9LED7_9FIRM|nr:MAG: sigma-E processing peptidase SpoIIGA [Candidatus Fermentithermobacillus carboniphilus]
MAGYIYADLLFFVNLSVNYIILLAAGKLVLRPVNFGRVLVASVLGSLYAVFAIVVPLESFFSLPARIAFGLFMVALSYPDARGISFVTLAGAFYLCSAVAAGTAMALLTLGTAESLRRGILSGDYPLAHWWMVGVSLVVVSVFPWVSRIAGFRSGKPLPLVGVELVVGGRTISLIGLVDTGNNLRDPVSGLPVIVVDWDSLKDVMPKEVQSFFLSTWDSISVQLYDTSISRRLRLIPYSNVSGRKGILPGFKPDRLALCEKNGTKVFKEAVVGVSESRLSPSGLYQALLHPDLVGF